MTLRLWSLRVGMSSVVSGCGNTACTDVNVRRATRHKEVSAYVTKGGAAKLPP